MLKNYPLQIASIVIGLLLVFISVTFLKEDSIYLWIRWPANILRLFGIISIPFVRVKGNKSTDKNAS